VPSVRSEVDEKKLMHWRHFLNAVMMDGQKLAFLRSMGVLFEDMLAVCMILFEPANFLERLSSCGGR